MSINFNNLKDNTISIYPILTINFVGTLFSWIIFLFGLLVGGMLYARLAAWTFLLSAIILFSVFVIALVSIRKENANTPGNFSWVKDHITASI